MLLDQLRLATQQPLRLPAARDTRLAAVCALLAADPADNRSLTELGARVGASERTLSRLFRAEFAMTFPQWRTQLRLHQALVLLATGEPVTSPRASRTLSTASLTVSTASRTLSAPTRWLRFVRLGVHTVRLSVQSVRLAVHTVRLASAVVALLGGRTIRRLVDTEASSLRSWCERS